MVFRENLKHWSVFSNLGITYSFWKRYFYLASKARMGSIMMITVLFVTSSLAFKSLQCWHKSAKNINSVIYVTSIYCEFCSIFLSFSHHCTTSAGSRGVRTVTPNRALFRTGAALSWNQMIHIGFIKREGPKKKGH